MPQNLCKYQFIALQNLSKNKDLITQKSDKGNSMVIVDRQDYIKKMDNILTDQNNFTKVNLQDDILLKFSVNHVDEVLKKLVESKRTAEKTRRLFKPAGSRPGVMFG